MASGNLGDLWFQLEIKDNTHKALNSMLKDVQRLEGMINSLNYSINKEQDPKKKKEMKEQLSNALNYLHLLQKVNIELNKISGIKNVNAGINTGELDRAKKALMDFRNELINLQSGKTAGGDDNAFMSAYNQKFRNLITDVRQIEKAFDKENTLSASKNNAARLNRELETTKNKLAEIQSLQSRGVRNRIDTTALLSGGNTLRGVKRRMEAMLADDNLLANGAKVKSLLSDIAYAYTKATGKVQEYKRAASETASVDSAFSKQKLAVEQINTILSNIDKLKGKSLEIGTDTSKLTAVRGEIERIKTTIESISGKQLLNKGFGDALNELQLWKERVNRTLKDQSGANQSAKATDRNLETMEARYRRLQELISEVSRKIRELNDSARQGIRVGADTSRAESAISRLAEMRDKFNNADIGSKNAVAELVSEYKILKNEIGNAKSEQDKLNNAITRANKKQDRKNERQEARDNKQRLSEIKATEARYDSLGNKVRALRREFSRGISLGADVSKAEAEIHRLIDTMRYLRQMRIWLTHGEDVVGRIGNIGAGHDTTLAGRVLQDQKATNAAAQEAINKGIRRGIDLEHERQQEIAKSAAKVRSDLAAALAGANAEASKMHGTLNDIKSLFLQGGIVYGAQSLFNAIVQTGGEIVQQHIALRSILGDVTKADELFAQTQELALRSPFKFGELNRDVKQLAAFGVEADSLYDTTKRLADIASGLGVSFERLGLAYGQVKARSWLDGKELRQFAYAGLPLLQKITELYNSEGKNNKTNYKQSDVKEMISKRQVSFEDVQKVLWKMTDEGGQFYNMQLVLSETLLGQWNKLKDAWEIMLSRFAEGKNIIGGTFMFAIKGATDLLLTIDKLSPALLTFASVFLSKKLFGFASSRLGIGSIGKNLNDQAKIQLRNYAIEQQQLVLERKITQEIATQNVQKRAYWLADVQTQQAVMGRLALEGKLSILQMQKAVREGLITRELVDQLVIMGQITAKQGEIILNGGKMAAVMNMAGSKLKGMLGFVGGWAGLAFMAVTQVISSIYNEFSAIKEKAESLQAPDSDWMKDYYDALDAKKGTTDTELKKQIDSMKQLLIKSDAYTKTIDEQIKKAKDLNEQYDILRKGVENAKNVASGDAGMIADAIGSTGGWKAGNPFNDTIEENLKDLQHSTDAYQLKLSTFDELTKSKMDSVASAILGAAGAGKTLEDKIRILADEGGQKWGIFQANMVKWNRTIAYSIYGLGKRANDVTSDINEIANDDVPKILGTMRKHLGLYGDDFKNWCNRNPERFRSMLLQIMDEATWLVPQIKKKLEELTGFKFEPSGNKTLPNGKTVMQQRVLENLHHDQKAYDLISSYIVEGSWYKTKNNAGSALQDLYNEMKSRQRGGASKSSIAEAKKDYETLHKAVLQGFGYNFIPQDKKSNKDPKNNDNKEDKELDELKRQLEDFKAARQAYQKLRKEAGMSRAKAKNEVFGLYKDLDWKKIDLDNYSGSIARLKDGFNFDKTNDRKKLRTQLDKENFEWRFSEELKPEWERVASNFKEALEKGIRQADLAKELYEKTGNKAFSDQAFKDGAIWDAKTLALAEDFKKMTGEDINIGWSDADAKKNLEGVQNGYELWQKITTLVKDKYVKSLQQAAEILEQTATYEEKIATINAKYEGLINTEKDPKIRARYEIQRDKEIGKVKLDQFKNSSDYLNFYGAIVSLGMDKAAAIGTEIRKNINDALQNGAIDAREYAKEIKQLEEQLSKLTKPRPSFLNGGLEGIVNAKKEKANEQITLGSSQYNEAKKKYDEAKINGNSLGMALAEQDMEAAQAMMKGGEEMLSGAMEMENSIATVSMIIHGINDLVQGLNDSFQDIKDTASALGVDTETNSWTDANAFFSGFASASASATKAFDSFKSGNIGGVISGAVGSVTGWIKSYAAAHDAKLERQIKLAERNITELERLRNDVKTAIENTLGGVYSYKMDKDTKATLKKVTDNYEKGMKLQESGVLIGYNGPYTSDTYNAAKKSLAEPDNAFLAEQASLMAQKDEMQRQLNAEQGKKKKDKDKIADYKQQIKEMETTIKQLATDFLKDIYGVDMKSWASQLTDAVVSAWSKGEDAIDAYKKKAREMVKDLTKNILSQKIMEKALEGPLEALTTTIKQKGRLEPEDVVNVADELYKQTDDAVYNITAILESLKDRGLDLSATGDGSVTNGIKNISEETADILASYVNAIRLDVSVNRAQVKDIGELLKMRLPEMGQIQKAQLGQLTQIVMLAEARNEKLDRMMDWMTAVSTSGRKKLYIS